MTLTLRGMFSRSKVAVPLLCFALNTSKGVQPRTNNVQQYYDEILRVSSYYDSANAAGGGMIEYAAFV